MDTGTSSQGPAASGQHGSPVAAGNKIRALLLPPLYDNPAELPARGILCLAGCLRDHPRIELSVPHCSLTPKYSRELLAEREYDAICTGGMLTCVDTLRRFLSAARELQPQGLLPPLASALHYVAAPQSRSAGARSFAV